MSRQIGRLIAAGIVLFWLIMMGLLVYHEVLLPRWHSAPPRSSASARRDVWMGIFVAQERAGFLHLHSAPELRHSMLSSRLDLTLKMSLSLMDRPTDLFVNGSALRTHDGSLSEFDFTIQSGEHEMRVNGSVAEGQLSGIVRTAGETLPLRLPVSDALLLGGGAGMTAIDVPLLHPGEILYVDSFDPTTMAVSKAKLTGVGEDTIALAGEYVHTFIVDASIGSIDSRAWLTADGEVVRAETPFGFSIQKMSPEEALAPVQAGASTNLIRSLAVRPAGKAPRRNTRLMKIRLSGVAEADLPPVSDLQRRSGDVFEVAASTLPESGADQTLPNQERADALASDVFVTADHEKIQELAQEIAGADPDPWRQAQHVYMWVYTSIEKTSVISVPNALEVLRTRQGDCNEHTILFTALTRALGIPTRIAIGLVWSDEMGIFGYHAWPEVFVGKWIAMDPTLGQPFADATHLKLLNGGIQEWTRLVPYIGRLEIEVLEVE
ncbi:MAG: transglutaminase domain-containing protein [Candidatus Hydrogenedentes bacterium]|nr:transglutaminase domain-containing protein [Candidatus Hydrogenedentota bacterium]